MHGMTNSENLLRYFYIKILVSVNTVIDLIDPPTLEHEDKVSFAIIMVINCALLPTTTLHFQFNV